MQAHLKLKLPVPSEKPTSASRKGDVIPNDVPVYMFLNWLIHWPRLLSFKYPLNFSDVKLHVNATEEAWVVNSSLQHQL